MVMAEREDPVAQRLALPVEEEKGPRSRYCDRGELLDPIAYGYPENRGRGYERRHLLPHVDTQRVITEAE